VHRSFRPRRQVALWLALLALCLLGCSTPASSCGASRLGLVAETSCCTRDDPPADACRLHGVKAVAVDEDVVRVVAPWGSKVRSRGFVRVRRTVRPVHAMPSQRVPYVDAPTAVIAAARLMTRERVVIAALSDAVQRRIVTPSELLAAYALGFWPFEPPLGGSNGLPAAFSGRRARPTRFGLCSSRS